MRTFSAAILCLVAVLAISGCGPQGSPLRGYKQYDAAPPLGAAEIRGSTAAHGTAPKAQINLAGSKRIKEAGVSFECRDLDRTATRIREAVSQSGGYITEDKLEKWRNSSVQKLKIRVPADNFDKLLERILSEAQGFAGKDIQERDVTEQYIDVQTRLKIKKEIEARYRELLAKAATVQEILSIEQEIGKVREEIESVEGKLRYLDNQIAYSTISVNFSVKMAEMQGFSSKLRRGLREGWNNFGLFILFLAEIWPFLVLAILVTFAMRMLLRWRKRTKQEKSQV